MSHIQRGMVQLCKIGNFVDLDAIMGKSNRKAGNLPSAIKDLQPECFVGEGRDTGGEANEFEGLQMLQNVLNMANFKFFELAAHFTSIPVTHEIRAARDINNGQIISTTLGEVGKYISDSTKYPSDNVATHSHHKPNTFPFEMIPSDQQNLKIWHS